MFSQFFLALSVLTALTTSNSLQLKSQNSVNDEPCYYRTDGRGASAGLQIRFSYPCSFQKELTDLRKGVVKHRMKPDGSQQASLIINNYGKENAADMRKGFTKESIGKGALSIRETKIDNIKAFETVVVTESETPTGLVYTKSLMYTIVYNEYLVLFGYGCAGTKKSKVENDFKQNAEDYRILASLTHFIK